MQPGHSPAIVTSSGLDITSTAATRAPPSRAPREFGAGPNRLGGWLCWPTPRESSGSAPAGQAKHPSSRMQRPERGAASAPQDGEEPRPEQSSTLIESVFLPARLLPDSSAQTSLGAPRGRCVPTRPGSSNQDGAVSGGQATPPSAGRSIPLRSRSPVCLSGGCEAGPGEQPVSPGPDRRPILRARSGSPPV